MDAIYVILITGLSTLSAYLIGRRQGVYDVNAELRGFLKDRTAEMKDWRDRALTRRGQSPLSRKASIPDPEERERKKRERAAATPYRVVQRTELMQRAAEAEARQKPKPINIARAIEKAEQIKKSDP